MLHIDKFEHLCLVPHILQIFCAQAVSHKSCETLSQKPVAHDRSKHLRNLSSDLPAVSILMSAGIRKLYIQFMLTARHRQDHFCIPADRLCQCIACRRVTGMKRDDHIHLIDTREGADVAVFATGLMVSEALKAADLLAAQGVSAAVINVHTVKPIDSECVTEWARKCGRVVTVEEHSVIGGLGDAVAEVLMGKVDCAFRKIGVQDQFGQSGKAWEVLAEYGLTAPQIAESIKDMV